MASALIRATMLALVLLSACTAPPSSADVWCRTNEPRRPTVAEYSAMDRLSKEDMRSFNRYGETRCGWTP